MLAHSFVVARCDVDDKFKLRALSAMQAPERKAIINEAHRWAQERGAV